MRKCTSLMERSEYVTGIVMRDSGSLSGAGSSCGGGGGVGDDGGESSKGDCGGNDCDGDVGGVLMTVVVAEDVEGDSGIEGSFGKYCGKMSEYR